MDHIEKEIKVADVITRKLLVGEEISEQEEAALRGWLEESERHRAWFREYREKLPLGEFEEVVQISDVKEQWQKLDQLTKERKHIGWRKWSAYAAGVALLLSVGLWWGIQREKVEEPVTRMAVIEPGTAQAVLILNDGEKIALKDRDTLVNTKSSSINIQTGLVKYDVKPTESVEVEYNTIEVPRGGIYSLVLSDGTKVFLNSDSRLKYPVTFNGEDRRVELSGEAFFEVVSDSLHPFIVHTRDMETHVLGTTFDIQAYPDELTTKTTLLTGRVLVSVNHLSLTETLKPGLQASWTKGTDKITVKKVNVATQALWRDGIIMLDDDELDDVIRMLARWYNVTYKFKGDRSVKHTFTGKIDRNEDLESVLKTLTLLGGPKFEIRGTVVYIL